VTDGGNQIKLSLVGAAVAGQASVHVYLNTKVRWQIRLAGGGLEQVVDFGTGRLAGLEILSGAGQIDVSVPKPEGTLAVRLAGGAGVVAVHAPTGPPAQVRLGAGGGAGAVTVDGHVHSPLQAGAVLTPDGWAQAKDRYDIEAAASLATLTVDRH
jgi:hypothetical protein